MIKWFSLVCGLDRHYQDFTCSFPSVLLLSLPSPCHALYLFLKIVFPPCHPHLLPPLLTLSFPYLPLPWFFLQFLHHHSLPLSHHHPAPPPSLGPLPSAQFLPPIPRPGAISPIPLDLTQPAFSSNSSFNSSCKNYSTFTLRRPVEKLE